MKNYFKALLLAGILPLSAFVCEVSNDIVTDKEEETIELSNDGYDAVNDETLSVPVTATVSNTVLNVKFTGAVSLATVSVSNTLTGATVSQQSLPAVSGTICNVPVTGLSMGNYTVSVTDENSGASVSGDFDVEEEE